MRTAFLAREIRERAARVSIGEDTLIVTIVGSLINGQASNYFNEYYRYFGTSGRLRSFGKNVRAETEESRRRARGKLFSFSRVDSGSNEASMLVRRIHRERVVELLCRNLINGTLMGFV